MSGHTPGPWRIQGDHGKLWIETNANDDTIAEVHRRKEKGSVYSCDEAMANARLIAAAPEMLEALELLLDGRHCQITMLRSDGPIPTDKARAAIAKAKGEM